MGYLGLSCFDRQKYTLTHSALDSEALLCVRPRQISKVGSMRAKDGTMRTLSDRDVSSFSHREASRNLIW